MKLQVEVREKSKETVAEVREVPVSRVRMRDARLYIPQGSFEEIGRERKREVEREKGITREPADIENWRREELASRGRICRLASRECLLRRTASKVKSRSPFVVTV